MIVAAQCRAFRAATWALSLAAVFLVGSIDGAWCAPITFNTALPVAKGEFIFRELFVLSQSGDDTSGSERDRIAWTAVSALGYGATPEFAFFAVLSYVDKNLEVTTAGQRLERRASGLGDLSLFGRYTVFHRDWPGRTLRLAPFVGLKLPTGESDERDTQGRLPPDVQPGSGSRDAFGGLVATYQTLQFQLDTQVAYRANKEDDDFEAGDVASFDTSLQYRLLPRQLGGRVPAFLYGVLEANLVHEQKNQRAGRDDPDSGGIRLFLTPGLQYVTRRFIIEAAVQLPVLEDLNGTALETDYVVHAGFRFAF